VSKGKNGGWDKEGGGVGLGWWRMWGENVGEEWWVGVGWGDGEVESRWGGVWGEV